MSFWHRAPRAVYSVYDEDDYLSAAEAQSGDSPAADYPVAQGAHDGDRAAQSQESNAPALGQIDAGHVERSRMASASRAGRSHDVFGAGPHHVRRGRVLALTVLCVVAASAAGLVAYEVSHRSAPAPAQVAGASSRPLRSTVASSNVPISKKIASNVSAGSKSSSPSPISGALAMPRESVRAAKLDVARARRGGMGATPLARSSALAVVAERYPAEPQPTPEPQANGEFGFER